MNDEIKFPTSGDADIRCLAFHNPDSINGPFGDMKLIFGGTTPSSGNMKIHTLWGYGTTTNLSLHEKSEIAGTYTYLGEGYMTSLGQKPQKVSLEISLSMNRDWTNGIVQINGADYPIVPIACDNTM